MARVLSIHEIELRPGVTAEEFERFVREEAGRLPVLPGLTLSVLKGDRGERSGRFLFMSTFDSQETRDRLYPAPSTPSAQMQRYLGDGDVQRFLGKWGTLATIPDQGTVYTDYVTIVTRAWDR